MRLFGMMDAASWITIGLMALAVVAGIITAGVVLGSMLSIAARFLAARGKRGAR